MQQQASDADELYILGDLFETWIGDDAIGPMAERVIDTFSQFSTRGGKLFFIHGNRDFLLGPEFAKATGGKIVQEPYLLTVAGKKTLLMHGDSLCTKDTEYINYRKMVRTTDWQQQFLQQNIQQRQSIARNLRDNSKSRGKTMSKVICDVSNDAVEQTMLNSNVSLLIHGHTHRQARHPLIIANQPAERIVLGDWGATGSVLVAENNELRLENFSLNI